MKFIDIPVGERVFLDANTLISYFVADPTVGPSCEALLLRIENGELQGFTAAHVLAEMTHRLMTVEACARFGWPPQGIALRLRNHPNEVQQLNRYRQALDELPQFPVQILGVTGQDVSRAAGITRQHGLLTNDAILVAVMRTNGLTHLASNDADFDRVTGLTRYTPV